MGGKFYIPKLLLAAVSRIEFDSTTIMNNHDIMKNSCYGETSPFLMRISLAILHTSQSPQKKVIKASLHTVP